MLNGRALQMIDWWCFSGNFGGTLKARKNAEADALNPNLYHSLENLANNSTTEAAFAAAAAAAASKDNRKQENLYEEIRQRTLKRQSQSKTLLLLPTIFCWIHAR